MQFCKKEDLGKQNVFASVDCDVVLQLFVIVFCFDGNSER